MSVKRARAEIDADEFNGWKLKIIQDHEEEWERFDRLDWQIAGLAWNIGSVQHTIANMFASNPSKYDIPLDKFLVRVGRRPEVSVTAIPDGVGLLVEEGGENPHPELNHTYTPEFSKSVWLSSFGIDPNDPSTWGGDENRQWN